MNDQLTEQLATECEGVLDSLANSLQDQLLVSQDRCVDGLLDVYNAAPTPAVRDLVGSVIDDIRHLTSVRSTDMVSKLDAIAAALAIETALADAADPLEEPLAP